LVEIPVLPDPPAWAQWAAFGRGSFPLEPFRFLLAAGARKEAWSGDGHIRYRYSYSCLKL
ncbi:MAG: hypothetical protein M3511_11695, partial [Deinococcota bacterium]|nr:hypothetical protein [Deinococcota bacterium]